MKMFCDVMKTNDLVHERTGFLFNKWKRKKFWQIIGELGHCCNSCGIFKENSASHRT